MATPKQARLISDAVENHLKYNDTTFAAYRKLRQDILALNTSIIKELNDNNGDSVPETGRVSPSTLEKLGQLDIELQKMELIYKAHIDELQNTLQIQKVLKPDILSSIKAQLESISKHNQELEDRIKNIKTIEKPLWDKITNLVASFNSNLATATARLIHPTIIMKIGQDELKREKESQQIDYRSLVFDKKELQKEFLKLTNEKLITTNIAEFLDSNTRIFDKFIDDDSKVIYKLPRSGLHDLDSTTTLDEYDELISKTITQIQAMQNEQESIKTSWHKNAEKIRKIDAIVNGKEDEDVEMS